VLGIGVECASALLVAAGDDPDRLRSEATFAHLCGASRIDASSVTGSTAAATARPNSALWRIVMTRTVCDPRTRACID
jgi:transposase